MDGFGLLMGHLIGDYIVQNDWMAANKTNPIAGASPAGFKKWSDPNKPCRGYFTTEQIKEMEVHEDKLMQEFKGHLACTVHCLLYTLAVWSMSFWWMPWWGLAACFMAHWAIDRFRLASWWMKNVSGQKVFATGPLSPWSIIVVDNTFHLLTLFLIALAAR